METPEKYYLTSGGPDISLRVAYSRKFGDLHPMLIFTFFLSILFSIYRIEAVCKLTTTPLLFTRIQGYSLECFK